MLLFHYINLCNGITLPIMVLAHMWKKELNQKENSIFLFPVLVVKLQPTEWHSLVLYQTTVCDTMQPAIW